MSSIYSMLEFKHFIGCFVFSDNFLAIRKPKFQQDITYAEFFYSILSKYFL